MSKARLMPPPKPKAARRMRRRPPAARRCAECGKPLPPLLAMLLGKTLACGILELAGRK